MGQFKSNKILTAPEIVAQTLRQARLEKKLSLKEASKLTRINESYLDAMECGQIDRLPPGVYRKNFLKEYALFLDLEPDNLVTLMTPEASQ